MKKRLKDIIKTGDALADGLTSNAHQHRNYNLYTSMERALGFLLTGDLFLSNGENWNDDKDRNLMKARQVYGTCFSCSTDESIAMWMLYGPNGGRNGAMLSFLPKVINELKEAREIDLGAFDKDTKKFIPKYHLQKADNDFESFLTDILYVDHCVDKEGKRTRTKISIEDQHCTVDADYLENKNIFYKNYAWSYEKECRLVVRLKEKWRIKAEQEKLTSVRIRLSPASLKKMNEGRLYRSPVYCGGADNGKNSRHCGEVKWSL